jgi:hypothetical protein
MTSSICRSTGLELCRRLEATSNQFAIDVPFSSMKKMAIASALLLVLHPGAFGLRKEDWRLRQQLAS